MSDRKTRFTYKRLTLLILVIATMVSLSSTGAANTSKNQETAASAFGERPGTIANPASQLITATVVWSYRIEGAIEDSPAAAELFGNGKYGVLVAANDYDTPEYIIYCFNGTTGGLLWTYTTGGAVIPSPVAADLFENGKLDVIAVSGDQNVYCLNGTTGEKLWSYTTGGVFYSSPVVTDLLGNVRKEVLVACYDGVLYCLNGTTGSKLWSFTAGDVLNSACKHSGPVVADLFGDGKKEVIVVSNYYVVYCLNGSTGSAIWSYSAPGGNTIGVSPVVGDLVGNSMKEVVVASYDHNIYCLNGSTGSELWRYTTGDAITSPLVVGDLFGNGKLDVIVGSNDHFFYCLNGTTGNKLWNFTTGSGYGLDFHSVVVDLFGDSGKEAVLGTEYYVYCLNGTTGEKVWNSTTGFIYSRPIVTDLYGDGKLEITGGAEQSVYCLNGTTGDILWTYPTEGSITFPPAVADLFGDGTKEVIGGKNLPSSGSCGLEHVSAAPGSGGSVVYCLSPTGMTLLPLAPLIDLPANIAYIIGQTGNTITWSPSSQIPDHYTISVDGSSPASYSWNGDTITYNVDGLSVGTHSVTCVVYDTRGRSASSTVLVSVEPSFADESLVGLAILGVAGSGVAVAVVVFMKLRMSKKGR